MVPPTFIEQRNQTLPTQRDGHKEVPPILIQNLGATHRDANSAFGNKTKALCYTDRDASRRKPNVVSAPITDTDVSYFLPLTISTAD